MITPPSRFTARIAQLRDHFDGLGINAFLVTHQPHLRYLSGFTGSSGLGLVTHDDALLVSDGRYAQQIRDEVRGWRIHVSQDSLFDALHKVRAIRSELRIGVDGNSLVLSHFRQLKKTFPGAKFLPKVDVVESIAAVKDSFEIDRIKRAVEISERTFAELLEILKPGLTEQSVAAEISYLQRTHGADGDSFEPIVVSGERSALPHGRPTSKKIARGDLLTLDFGCVVDGYHSDMTRTIGFGKLSPEARKVYKAVHEAQERSVDTARSGLKTRDLDGVARTVIGRHGYGKYFRHSLGHGIGLQIHESPRISVQSKATLESGNVITIEPGVYIPRLGGVRIEDIVVVGNGGSDDLNRSTKDLIIL